MPTPITAFRVFIASPGDLQKERKAFREAIETYNQAEAIHSGVLFIPVGWEDTLGGVGRPQSIINRNIRDCDFFVLLLWNRWGSRPDRGGSYTSGTEEEFAVALECLKDESAYMRQIVMFFKGLKPKQLADPEPQLSQVIEFRKRIEAEKEHLFHSFDVTNAFKDLLTKHLGAWLRAHEQNLPPEAVTQIAPSPSPEAAVRDNGMPSAFSNDELKEAWLLANEGRRTEAETIFARAVVEGTNPEALIEYGHFLRRDGRLDQAMVMFARARVISASQVAPVLEARALTGIGHVVSTRGDLPAAEEMYRKALAINEALGRMEGLASTYGNLGIILRTRGDLAAAEGMYRKALDIDEKLGELEGMAQQYGNLGIVLGTRGDVAAAEEMFRKALEINKKLGRLEGVANQYGNLGIMFGRCGDLAGAEEMYSKALEIDEKLGRLEQMAGHYGNLGNVLRTRGDLAGAEKMYQKALGIDKKLGRLEGIAAGYASLGSLLVKRGSKSEARELLSKSIEIYDRIGIKQMADRVASWLEALEEEEA